MDSCDDTPKGWVAPFGHPRINACSRLPVAFRSVPRPSSPPGAKASTECPSLARDHDPPASIRRPSTMHRNHPQRSSISARSPTAGSASCSSQESLLLSTQQSPLNTTSIAGDRPSGQHVRSDMRWQRPETHQNLIHPDKDLPRTHPRDGASIWRHLRHRSSILSSRGRTINADCFRFSAIHARITPTRSPHTSNQDRGGGDRTRTDDPLLAKQVLSQLSYTPKSRLGNEEHWWAREDLNLRPHAYQACALTS